MSKLAYMLSRSQYSLLQSLAYWHADKQYLLERYGQDDAKNEIQKAHESIMWCFHKLDEMRVPYWVQNVVLFFSEDWRREKSQYLDWYLEHLTDYNIKINWEV